MTDMKELHRRVQSIEAGREGDRERLREVETAIVRLSELPDRIDRWADRFEDVIRLDGRVGRLEDDRQDDRALLERMDRRLDGLDVKMARYAGAIAVAVVVAQTMLHFMGG